MKLLIADDHNLFRDALVQYIERADTSANISAAEDFRTVMNMMLSNSDRDLVLLDLRMPGMNGLNGLSEFVKYYPEIPVAMMSGVAEKHEVEEALQKGAVGYFPKTLSGDLFLEGIKKILRGERFVPRDEQENTILPSYYDDSNIAQDGDFSLTSREQEVLGYLAKGYSNKRIGEILDLKVVTIKLHVSGICRKLNVKNRTEAALKAQKLGIAHYK